DAVGAVVVVEGAVLDGDESLRHVGRHFLQRQWSAGEISPARQRATLKIHDLNGWRALRDFERLDRRRGRADPGDKAGGPYGKPQAGDQAPVGNPADEVTLADPRSSPARGAPTSFGSWLVVRRSRTVFGGGAQIGSFIEHGLPTCARLSLFRRHNANPSAPARARCRPRPHHTRVDLRGR